LGAVVPAVSGCPVSWDQAFVPLLTVMAVPIVGVFGVRMLLRVLWRGTDQ
jgi:hypothetical protein